MCCSGLFYNQSLNKTKTSYFLSRNGFFWVPTAAAAISNMYREMMAKSEETATAVCAPNIKISNWKLNAEFDESVMNECLDII